MFCSFESMYITCDGNVNIRDARGSDIEFLNEILLESSSVGREFYEQEDYVFYPGMPLPLGIFPQHNEFGFIAEDCFGNPYGAAWIRKVPHMDVMDSYLLPELTMGIIDKYRNLGIGGHLLNAIQNKAKEFQLNKMRLSVHKNNHIAKHLYLKNGWKLIAEVNEYLIMTYDII